MPVSIDEFNGKPSGTMTADERMRGVTFGFPNITVVIVVTTLYVPLTLPKRGTLISRAVVESPLPQGEDEIIPYSLTTTPWLSAPTGVVVTVRDANNNYADVTSIVMPINTPTVSGDVIYMSPLKLLAAGHLYVVGMIFSAGGLTEEAYLEVPAEK